MKLVSAAEMRELDRKAIEEYGIPGIVLMENAGAGSVDFLVEELGDPSGSAVVIFVGPGNNGGDGLVMARHLHQLGARVQIFYLIDPQRLTGDAACNYQIVSRLRLAHSVTDTAEKLDHARAEITALHGVTPVWALVDALFGTGLSREIGGHFLHCITLINRLRETLPAPVCAVDIASGIGSDDGRVLGGCVRADYTATYGLAKPGHVLQAGLENSGRLRVIDITIPNRAAEGDTPGKELLTRQSMAALLKPRSPLSHKGSHGHLLVVAGSTGKTGAAILCARGALRCGTGLVSLAVPRTLNPIFETTLSEAMTITLPASQHAPGYDDHGVITSALAGKTALVLGPGLTTGEETARLVRSLYREVELPMVIDADGLNILATAPELLQQQPPAARILTPHPGEMARLLGCSSAEIQADRLGAVARLAGVAGLFCVLKGAGTVIGGPDGRAAINSSGNAGMAGGGMGDVLAGLIGGLLAQGYSPWDACRLGVFVHGAAADQLAGERHYGYLASEVAEAVPGMLTELGRRTSNRGGKVCSGQKIS